MIMGNPLQCAGNACTCAAHKITGVLWLNKYERNKIIFLWR